MLSDGEPIQDVGFLLFSKSVTQKVSTLPPMRMLFGLVTHSAPMKYCGRRMCDKPKERSHRKLVSTL